MNIKVGDIVTWRHGKSTTKNILPIGIAGCEVLLIGIGPDGRLAAKLKLPEFFRGLPQDACNGYLDDMEREGGI